MGRDSKLQEYFDGIEHCHPSLQRKFVEILMKELTTLDISDKSLYLQDIYNFLTKFSPIYFDVINQRFGSLKKLRNILNQFDNFKSIQLILNGILIDSFEKLYKNEIRWDYELDIEPVRRDLLILDKIPFDYPTSLEYLKRDSYSRCSDSQFEEVKQEFECLLRDQDNKKLLSVGISYSYANIILPKSYEIIFDSRDLTKFWERKVIVKYAFNFRKIFHADLWRGHHSHCFIEVIGEIPPIFDELPNNGSGNGEHKGIGLCTKYDWEYIKDRHY